MDPEQGKSGRPGAGFTEAPGLCLSLCLLAVLSPHFGFSLQFRAAFALTYLLTGLKSILQLPLAGPTDSCPENSREGLGLAPIGCGM